MTGARIVLLGITALLAGTAGVIAVLIAVGVLGDDGGGPSGDDIAQRVFEAINRPGMVYHTASDDGAEVWIDAEEELFRRKEATADGELITVGSGWSRTVYDAFQNEVRDEDLTPEGPDEPRIDHPMISWTDALAALGYGRDIVSLGRIVSDGRDVIAVEATSPIVGQDGSITGTLVGRVEIDPVTYLPYSFERGEIRPSGQTPGAGGFSTDPRTVYEVSEMVPRASLPDGFFDRSVVEAQVLTRTEALQRARDIGLTPLWAGETYEGDYGILSLPPQDAIFVNTNAGTAELHYALIVILSETQVEPLSDSVVIRLALDAEGFGPPEVQGFAPPLPEQEDSVTVRGEEARLYTSLISASDLPCRTEVCPETDALVYRRLIFAVGETAVQIEALSRVDAGGTDRNGYNTRDGIIALAEALFETS